MTFSRFGYLQIWAFVLTVLALSATPSPAQLPQSIQQIADPLNLTSVFGGPQIAGNSIRFQPPHLDRVPYFIQGLPAQLAQSFVNPVGSALASRIRQERQTVRSQGCGPAPDSVVSALSPFMPPSVFNGVCWTILRPGVSIATLVIQDGGMAAVTFDDTIVFKDQQSGFDPVLWAHELIHVGQYRRLSVEGFANIYTYDFRRLEGEAYGFQDFVAKRIDLQQGDNGWRQGYYNRSDNWNPDTGMTGVVWAQQARRVVDPRTCVHPEQRRNDIGSIEVTVVNNCPVTLILRSFTETSQSGPTIYERCVNCEVPSDLPVPGTSSSWTVSPPPGYVLTELNLTWPMP
jgi:hypothetical protein